MATAYGAMLDPIARASVAQFLAVDAGGNVCAPGAQSAGFLTAATTPGALAPICTSGTANAVAGAAFPRGALLEVGTAGRVVTWAGGKVCGRAATTATAAGDVVEIDVMSHRNIVGVD